MTRRQRGQRRGARARRRRRRGSRSSATARAGASRRARRRRRHSSSSGRSRTTTRRRTGRTSCNAVRDSGRPRSSISRLRGGPGSARSRGAKRCTRELGLERVVTLTGYRPDAVRLMAGCDVFVLASKWEGLPGRVDGGKRTRAADRQPLGSAVFPTRSMTASTPCWSARRRPSPSPTRSNELIEDDGVAPDSAAGSAAQRGRLRHRPRRCPDRSHLPAGRAAMIDALEIARGLRPTTTCPRSRSCCATRWAAPTTIASKRCSAGSTSTMRSAVRPMWVACDGDRIVGLRTLMRWEFERAGEIFRCVRAVDTATHPELPGPGHLQPPDARRAAGPRSRGRRLRLQHSERPEPPRLPQDGLADRRAGAGSGASAVSVRRRDRARAKSRPGGALVRADRVRCPGRAPARATSALGTSCCAASRSPDRLTHAPDGRVSARGGTRTPPLQYRAIVAARRRRRGRGHRPRPRGAAPLAKPSLADVARTADEPNALG